MWTAASEERFHHPACDGQTYRIEWAGICTGLRGAVASWNSVEMEPQRSGFTTSICAMSFAKWAKPAVRPAAPRAATERKKRPNVGGKNTWMKDL